MAVIKKTNKKCWWRSRGWKRIPTSCWWKCKLVQPPWKAIWRLLRRLRSELPYSPAVLLQGTYPRDSKTQLLHCSTIYRSQVRNANKVSVNRWVNGEGKCSVQAQWNFTQPQEWNCVVCRKNKQTNGDYHMQKNKLTQRDKYHTDFILTHKVICGYRAWAEKSTNLWNDRSLRQEKMEGGRSQSKDTIDLCGNKPLWNPSLRNVYYYTKKKKTLIKNTHFPDPKLQEL